MRGWVAVLVAVLAVLAGAGCATTTQGHGRTPSVGASARTPDFPSTAGHGTSTSAPLGTPSPTSTAPTSPVLPDAHQRGEQLDAQSNGAPHVLVPVPGGYEAATYDTAGHIAFWRVVGTEPGWRRVGTSRYPAEVTGTPFQVQVAGARLSRMTHATFIVRGQFTTDNSGLAVAYTTGPKGWGTIKAEPNGNIGPSGAPIGSDRIGLSRGFAFVHGKLETKDCPQDRPISACDSNEIVKLWVWTGRDFTRAG